jgi:hypothetical protein
MPVTCEGFVASESGWRQKSNGSAERGSRATDHAERVAWAKLPGSAAFLLVQNAYPCCDCHQFFKGESLKGHAIVIKVDDNQGDYSADHFQDARGRPILRGSLPCIIYYFNGVSTHVTMSDAMAGRASGPPANFPAIPDLPE